MKFRFFPGNFYVHPKILDARLEPVFSDGIESRLLRKGFFMITKSFILVFLVLFSLPSLLAASYNLIAEADDYIVSAEPTTNYGNEASLYVKNVALTSSTVPSTYCRKSYLRFNLSGVVEPITTASFQLTVNNEVNGNAVSGTQVFNVYGLNNLTSGENWGESTINWNNAPGNNTTSAYEMNSNTTLLGTFTLVGVGVAGTTVTLNNANLVNFLNADTNNLVTLIVTRVTYQADDAGWIHSFASSESTAYAKPTLALTSVPEPTSAVLLCVAMGLAACSSWRKNSFRN